MVGKILRRAACAGVFPDVTRVSIVDLEVLMNKAKNRQKSLLAMPRYTMKRGRARIAPVVRFVGGAEAPRSMGPARDSSSAASSSSTPRMRAFVSSTDTRRDRLLKRILGVVRKILQIGWIAGPDIEFALVISCRDPRNNDAGYNCFASSSDAPPRETLAHWTRRLEVDDARKEKNRQFSIFGPSRDPKSVPATLFSFPHRAIFPDSTKRGCRDDDSEDEVVLERMETRSRAATVQSVVSSKRQSVPASLGEPSEIISVVGTVVNESSSMNNDDSGDDDSSDDDSASSHESSDSEPDWSITPPSSPHLLEVFNQATADVVSVPSSSSEVREPKEAHKTLRGLISFLKGN